MEIVEVKDVVTFVMSQQLSSLGHVERVIEEYKLLMQAKRRCGGRSKGHETGRHRRKTFIYNVTNIGEGD